MGRDSWSNREVVEDIPRLTIQELKKWGYLKKGENSGILTFYRNGKKSGSIRITVIIDSYSVGVIKFEYLLNSQPVKYSHYIDLIPCYYGNHRFYFVCRDTKKRVTALYMVGGYFSSRHFHKLVYQCSREHRSFFNLLHKSLNLKNKGEWMEKIGHPIKAKRFYRKAEIYDYEALEQASNRFSRELSKYTK